MTYLEAYWQPEASTEATLNACRLSAATEFHQALPLLTRQRVHSRSHSHCCLLATLRRLSTLYLLLLLLDDFQDLPQLSTGIFFILL